MYGTNTEGTTCILDFGFWILDCESARGNCRNPKVQSLGRGLIPLWRTKCSSVFLLSLAQSVFFLAPTLFPALISTLAGLRIMMRLIQRVKFSMFAYVPNI
jgi:hypothetical protein